MQPRQWKALQIFILILFVFHIDTQVSTAAASNMQVHFIDVGQGDSILIETPNENVLIDGGPPAAGDKVVQYLRDEGIETLDMIITTHPDIDHIGGLVPVIEKFNVEEILDSGKPYYTGIYFNYLQQIYNKGIPVTVAKFDQTRYLDKDISFQILNDFSLFKNNNQSSLALKLKLPTMLFR